MRVLVWGLGYVGTVSAACLAAMGHEVIGIEPNPAKVAAIRASRSTITEPGLDELIADAVASGALSVEQEGGALVASADVSLICVGTPSTVDGALALTYLLDVAEEIGRGLRTARNHCVVVRSTVTPGTTRNVVLPTLEKLSGRRAGTEFGLAMNPEFLREATAVHDFREPPYTVVGALDDTSAQTVEDMYSDVGGRVHQVAIEEAELLKLLNNSFHALKIGFANEVGRIAAGLGLDSHRIMNLVCADTKLNISSSYLTPGFAFGGSCLPKDLRALTAHAHSSGAQLPILSAVLPSNGLQVDEARRRIQESGARRVGVLGLSFKAGTDDVRESPLVSLVRTLWQDGYDVTVYDPDVQLDSMLGTNRDYLERQLPQIGRIIAANVESVVAASDLIVVGQQRPEFRQALESAAPAVTVLDLVRLHPELTTVSTPEYQGLSW